MVLRIKKIAASLISKMTKFSENTLSRNSYVELNDLVFLEVNGNEVWNLKNRKFS